MESKTKMIQINCRTNWFLAFQWLSSFWYRSMFFLSRLHRFDNFIHPLFAVFTCTKFYIILIMVLAATRFYCITEINDLVFCFDFYFINFFNCACAVTIRILFLFCGIGSFPSILQFNCFFSISCFFFVLLSTHRHQHYQYIWMDFRIVNKCLTTIFDVIECIVYIDVDISETHTQSEPIKYSIVIIILCMYVCSVRWQNVNNVSFSLYLYLFLSFTFCAV